MSSFKRFLNFILELFYPKFCLGCGKEGTWICSDCFEKIKALDSFYCPVCRKRLPNGEICKTCSGKTKLSKFFAAARYESPLIKKAVHKLKYNFIKDLAPPLSSLIINFLKNFNFDSDFLIIPVPLHKSREHWRGFNQANELAKEISKSLRVPLDSNELTKIKNVPPQVEVKDYQKRKENIQGAFRVKRPELLRNKRVILIDDVYTSGSTMEECATQLLKAGVKEIWGVAAIAKF